MTSETFELYHKSGVRRTIRLKAWGFATKSGVLRLHSLRTGSRKHALLVKGPREKLVELEVTIKAKTG